MIDVRAFYQGAWRARVIGVLVAIAAGAVAYGAWTGEQRRAGLKSEVAWLRTRLAEKREQVARQREELAQVASAAERVARTTGALLDRTTEARRLVQMEESRTTSAGVVPAAASAVPIGPLVSEDAARALEQLSLVDGQASAAADSVAILTALLRDRPFGETHGAPSVWPVRGAVTSPFGARPSPYDGTREMHPGIDIQAGYGTPVTASGDGTIIFAGRDAGYGGLVIVSHGDDVDSFYGHLSAIYVREGQRVRRGQTVGAVGASGRATGAHLHYEVRVRNRPVDPTKYLAGPAAG
jgi:murein DD-endopeptidase MepM/ murein hydrolase activator NlpD